MRSQRICSLYSSFSGTFIEAFCHRHSFLTRIAVCDSGTLIKLQVRHAIFAREPGMQSLHTNLENPVSLTNTFEGLGQRVGEITVGHQ